MKDQEAIAEFERWFASLERQQQRADEMQRLAKLARTDKAEAQRQLRQLDRTPRVYDGANLYPAVRHAWRRLKALSETDAIEQSQLEAAAKEAIINAVEGPTMDEDGNRDICGLSHRPNREYVDSQIWEAYHALTQVDGEAR